MWIPVVGMAGTCCAHQIWIDLDNSKDLKPLAAVLWNLEE